jgi:plasmid stabilization system protein ParE
MKRYSVRISPEAWSDLEESLVWGIREWGAEGASEWLDRIQLMIRSGLSAFPRRCPAAPEASGMGDPELRQLIIARYRVLFTVADDEVLVLHVVGAYVGDSDADGPTT